MSAPAALPLYVKGESTMAEPRAASGGSKKVVNTTETMSRRVSNADIDKMARDAGRILKTFRTKKVTIPKLEDSKNDTLEVCYNGYNLLLKRGVPIVLPVPIIRMLKQSEIEVY
jgi:hypothetical protein